LKPDSLDKATLLSRIKTEFWSSSPPEFPQGWDKLTDDVGSSNYWEGIEETKPFWGKDWSELVIEDYQHCRGVFTFVPKESLPYFIGGYMTVSLLGTPDTYGFTDMFVMFDPREERRKTARRTWVRNRNLVAPLNMRQRIVIADFIDFTGSLGLDEDMGEFMKGFLRGDIHE
jgi:hypothetical protein